MLKKHMALTIAVALPKEKKAKLERLALRYGLSLPEFSRRVLEELAAEIPTESLSGYKHPKRIKASLARALRDWKAGRVTERL